MDGKEAIINKIINDSEKLAQSFIKDAEQKRDKTISDAETLASDYVSRKKIQIAKESDAIIKRKESAADIEVKKMLLSERQQIIDKVINSVRDNIKKTDKTGYKNFLHALVEKNAEDGDIVMIAKEDKAFLSEDSVKKIAAKKGIKLGYQTDDKISGGVILMSDYYDKNLTTVTLLKQVKENHITEINQLLFKQGQ